MMEAWFSESGYDGTFFPKTKARIRPVGIETGGATEWYLFGPE